MKFSVVIPVFNRSKPLERAILSVLNQSYKNFEILVVDDGSSQEWANEISNVVSGFSDKRIELILHPHNINGAAARNTGIIKASGDYICFLDSDDTWLSPKLLVLKKWINEQSVINHEIVFHNQYRNVDNGVESDAKPIISKKKGESLAHYSFVTNNVGGIQSSTICLTTALAKRVLFNDKLKGHQDWDFCLRVGYVCDNFVLINQVLTLRYRDQCDSVASQLDWLYSLNFLRQYKVYFTLKETAYFMERVVVLKAKQANSVIHLLGEKIFWQSLLIKPKMVKVLIKAYLSQRQLKKRLNTLFFDCDAHNYTKLILWGRNHYTHDIIRGCPKGIRIVAILDSKAPPKGGFFEGFPFFSINEVPDSLMQGCDAIVFVTDKHQKSMQEELLQSHKKPINTISL